MQFNSVLCRCVANSARSQMAEAFLKKHGGGRFLAESAGLEPGKLNPFVVRAMAEVGIDISTQSPKILTTDAVEASDVVITMGCGDTCPYDPGKLYEDWDVPDPHGQPINVVRDIRDELQQRVTPLLRRVLV